MNSFQQIILVLVTILQNPTCGEETNSVMYPGVIAQPGEVPYHVSFKKADKETVRKHRRFSTFCGGAIITRVKIVTIAKCFNTTEKPLGGCQPCYAVAGTIRNMGYHSIKRMSHEQWRHILMVKYSADILSSNDIAIVTVNRTFVFNNFVKPIQVGYKEDDFSGYCNFSGYSRPSFGLHSDSLLATRLFLMQHHECVSINKEGMLNFICAVNEIPYSTPAIEKEINTGSPLVCPLSDEQGVVPLHYPGLLVGLMTENTTFDDYSTLFSKLSSHEHFIEKEGVSIRITGVTTKVNADETTVLILAHRNYSRNTMMTN